MPRAPGGSSAGRSWCIQVKDGTCLRPTSQSASQTAPLVGEPLAKPFTLRGLPKPPLLGQQQRPPPAAETGSCCWGSGQQAASKAQRMLGAATRAVARRRRDGEVYNAAFSAASTTWLTRTEVVTVPTPPGTGVMASTTGSASPKRTSPQSFPSSLTWMPTSTTT